MKKKYSKMKLPAADVTLNTALHGLQSLQLASSDTGQLKPETTLKASPSTPQQQNSLGK